MKKVKCVSIREFMPKQIEVGKIYYMDEKTKWKDEDGDEYAVFYSNNNGEDKYYIDTVKINVKVMKKLGIKKEHIFCSNICTKCNSNIYHSYRDCKSKKIESGRNIALICLK